MEQYVNLISQVGFPIFMVLWFMFRTEKVIKNNTKALTDMKLSIEKCPINK